MAERKDILVCVASSQEEKSCRAGILASSSPDYFNILHTGMGLNAARMALGKYLYGGNDPDLIISAGSAGAITDPIPSLYSWVTAGRIFSEEQELEGVDLYRYSGVAECAFISVPYIFKPGDPAPQVLGSYSGPQVVDTESAALAEVASKYNIPFMALRLIIDAPEKPFPSFVYTLSNKMLVAHYQRKWQYLPLCLNDARKDVVGTVHGITALGRIMKSQRLLREGWTKFAPELINYI